MDSERPEAVTLENRLRQHVQRLAGDIGERNVAHPEALEAAASYVDAEWTRQGYAVGRLAYDVLGTRCTNLEITRSGDGRRSEILLIGAHYDSVVGSPGANDNASGVAVLIELSRSFRTVEPAMTVRFVAFVNEEAPFFWTGKQGSMVYARTARSRDDDIRLMVSLETLGWYNDRVGSQSYPPLFDLFYPNRANFVAMVSDFRSRTVMRQLATAFRAHSDFPVQTAATFRFVPGVSWSDHRSFWQYGYRALMITDTAFYRYRHYHMASDTPDKLDYPRLSRVTSGLSGALIAVAERGI